LTDKTLNLTLFEWYIAYEVLEFYSYVLMFSLDCWNYNYFFPELSLLSWMSILLASFPLYLRILFPSFVNIVFNIQIIYLFRSYIKICLPISQYLFCVLFVLGMSVYDCHLYFSIIPIGQKLNIQTLLYNGQQFVK
jgi:hypothetical protein